VANVHKLTNNVYAQLSVEAALNIL